MGNFTVFQLNRFLGLSHSFRKDECVLNAFAVNDLHFQVQDECLKYFTEND